MFFEENRNFGIKYDAKKDVLQDTPSLSQYPETLDICLIPKSTTFTYLPDVLQRDATERRLKRNEHEISNNTETTAPNKERPVTQEDVYDMNGGTSLAVTVHNKLIIASDTRHSSEYTINARKMTKIFKIGTFYLTTSGFFADSFEIYTQLSYQMKQYETYGKMSLGALAHILHNLLYSRRFFPYYTYCILSGIDNGEAAVYSYDPVGSYQKTQCRCYGSGAVMIQPLLDSWISGKNFKGFQELSFTEVVELVKKAFDAASERDVTTKDYLEIYIVDEEGEKHEYIELRHD